MRTALSFLLSLILAGPAFAGEVRGKITDKNGGALTGAVVRLLNIVTGAETSSTTDAQGTYRFADLTPGQYRLAASRQGFSELSKTVVVTTESQTVDFTLEIGVIKAETTALADRGVRDTQLVPLRVDTMTDDTLRALVPVSTGDALLVAPGITPVGSGPFQVRPRLRGLDSTRVLVLLDGNRLNNARTATDRAGIEVGLIDPDSMQGVEVLGGAGSVLYGTDALSGTINIITNRAQLSPTRQLTMGFDGFYSSNENGRRGTVTLGFSNSKLAVRFVGGQERFDNYKTGGNFQETSLPFFASGTLTQLDTIDSNFDFNFNAFPDPFNQPFTRESKTIPASGMDGSSINLAATAKLSSSQRLDFKYQRRRATDVGFPDFEAPFFFQSISLPFSDLDKVSGTYSVTNPTRWLATFSATAYYQMQNRLLRNQFPVQFPAPSATFFPISVFRLNILSDTQQQIWTPGVDAQATFLTRPNNVLTAGLSVFRDRSEDTRTTTTETTMLGVVALGQFGPAATVFPSPTVLGPPSVSHPVRVPNSEFRDIALFLHNEYTFSPSFRMTAGLRMDGYRVVTEATPGYSIESLITGAFPPIDPATLPNVNGDKINRAAITGELGMVAWAQRPLSFFAHYVHSYRHPNLEELLFSGPATAGNVIPNITVEPETGHNLDAGARFRLSNVAGSVSYFLNNFNDFISTEVVSTSSAGSISQAINLARVRIQGFEAQAEAPFVVGKLVWSPNVAYAYTRGTVLEGTSPLSRLSLAGEPQDNITPQKITAGIRVADRGDHWWASYSFRGEAEVTRVSPLLTDSPFLIAQDLMSLAGFNVQRVTAGYEWRKGNQRVGLTFSADNLTDRFFREQFQFAPARGRSFSFAVHVRGVQ